MFATILFVFVLLVGLGLLGWLLWNKWEQLRLLDPESLPDAQTRKLKYDILRKRVHRTSDKYAKTARTRLFVPLGKFAQQGVRRIAGKLTAAERSYQKRQRQTGVAHVDKETVRGMMQQAREWQEQGEWDRAEKAFIEVISTNPRHTEAYERLGRLYFQKKEYDLALETWQFLNKLAPEDASVLTALGEVEDRRGNLEEARAFYEQAMELRPNNPKYLDFMIDLLVRLGDVHEATRTLDRLREVNPDNKKIPSFEQRIEEARQKHADG